MALVSLVLLVLFVVFDRSGNDDAAGWLLIGAFIALVVAAGMDLDRLRGGKKSGS